MRILCLGVCVCTPDVETLAIDGGHRGRSACEGAVEASGGGGLRSRNLRGPSGDCAPERGAVVGGVGVRVQPGVERWTDGERSLLHSCALDRFLSRPAVNTYVHISFALRTRHRLPVDLAGQPPDSVSRNNRLSPVADWETAQIPSYVCT